MDSKLNAVMGVQFVLMVGSLHAQAQAQAPAEVKYVTTAASDARNFIGDRIDYPAVLQVEAILLGGKTTESVCIPANTSLRGMGVASVKLGEAQPKDHVLFKVGEVATDETGACGSTSLVKHRQTVALDPDLLVKVPPNRYGLTYGTLIVPYKYQFGGDRSVAGGATLGGYFGYRVSTKHSSMAYIAFAGPTKVDVATTKNGKAETESLAGLSYGLGVLGTIKEGFKAGVVIGTDRVAKGAGYVNNGKPWISLSLGYDFTAN